MASRRVELRMESALAQWLDAYAEQRGSTRTAVIEAALYSFKRDSETGVPDLPGPPAKVPPRAAVPSVRRAAVRPPVPASVPVVPASSLLEDRAAMFRAATQKPRS